MRLISSEGKNLGIVSLADALKIAENKGLDLVEISPDANPPVCKILDYGKFRYERQKKLRKSKVKQKSSLKEIKFRPKIEEHDYQVKLKKVREFLEDGYKVKVVVIFRGREMVYLNVGNTILYRLMDDVSDVGKFDREPKKEGRSITAIISPK